MQKILFLSVLLFLTSFVNAQQGVVSGTLYDAEYNDVLAFANISVKGTNKGVISDFEGKYKINLDLGTYTLVFSFVGYQTQEITNVVVTAEKTVVIDVSMKAATASLGEVIITTTLRTNTESSVLKLQKKAVNVVDGLSSEAVKKTGSANLAAAVKSVPGVSVEGGKYVYVRGLGDRYTKSVLNGMDVPGLDPDRNTLQLDIFPSSLIENLIVYKSLTADLPADFTGGAIDIVTKDFASRKESEMNVGLGFNPSMHFNPNFRSEKGSGTDFLGFDNGLRDDPLPLGQRTPQPSDNDPTLTSITRLFNPTMAGTKNTSLMDMSLGYSTSNQYDLGENKLGYIGSIGYQRETTFYKDFAQNFFFKPQELTGFDLIPNRLQEGELSKTSVILSGLAGLTYKTRLSKFKLVLMRIQNGTGTAGIFDQQSFVTNAATFQSQNLEYTEKSISNALLTGKHSFKEESKLSMEWKLNGSLSNVYDKDVRSTLFEEDDGQFIIRPSIGEPRRIWRNLDEINLSSKLDFDYEHSFLNEKAKLKFGFAQLYKQRDFEINQYIIRIQGAPAVGFNGDPNRLLLEDNLWTTTNSGGTYIFNNFEPANLFESSATNYAAYVSEEFNISERLKSVVGLRFEKYDLFYTGANTQGTVVLENENIIDEADFFPSANLIYALNEQTNLRFSYSRSTARPSFKEASIAQIFDPISNITYNGNIELRPTYVNNFDIRYEIYGDDKGLIAVSGFYKDFTDPIELTIFGIQAVNDVTPRNIGNAVVYGAELEMRKNLGFVAPALDKFSINTNFSIIQSEQTMNDAEFLARQTSARVGETISNKRQLQGQAPYLINVGVTYADEEKGLQGGFFYNVQGETLEIVGIGQVSDVFTNPFHRLDFNASKVFGKDKDQTLTLGVRNILNDQVQSFYKSFNTSDVLFSNFSPGVEFTLRYGIRF